MTDESLLRYFAEENAKHVLPPARRGQKMRAFNLAKQGLLKVAGYSVMWGDLYYITDAGRAALGAQEKGERR